MLELSGSFFIERDESKIEELVERGFGVQEKEGLLLSVCEALYLLEKGRIEVKGEGGGLLDFGGLMRLVGGRDRLVEKKYAVYKFLRGKGHVARIAKNDEGYFRVYRNGKRTGDEPSKYLVKVAGEDWAGGMREIEAELKKAAGLRKELVIAFVKDGEVSFVAVGRKGFD